ncbi:amidohydrolase family protein [Lachnospiraceae bacterium 62-35]
MYLDTIIHGGTVITMEEPGLGIIDRGAIGIKGNQIEVVGPEDEIMKTYMAHRYIDGKNKVIMPGLIDAHTHSMDAAVRGLAQDMEEWMQRGIYPAETDIPDEYSVLGSKVALLELMKCGTTTVMDYAAPMLDIIQNFYDLGLRGHVASLVNEMPSDYYKLSRDEYFEYVPEKGEQGLKDTIRLIEEHHEKNDKMITCMIGPHAADFMSPELLMELKELSRKTGLDIHMHVSQGEREENQMIMRYGKRTIPYLADRNFLDSTVHCVHLYSATMPELEYVAKAGCSMTCCASSIAAIDGLRPPVTEFMNFGGKAWAMGTDQTPGACHNNMFYEMRFTALLNKMYLGKPSAFTAYEMLRAATIGNAKAFGLDDRIGSLKKGKKADLIIIDLEYPYFHPLYKQPIRNIVPLLAFGANGNEVETVIINGKVVIDNYKVLTVDEKALYKEADKTADQIKEIYGDRYDGHILKEYTDKGLY